MEGPKDPSEARYRREAPERRGRWNEKLVHLALGLFTLGALFQNNLGR